MKDEQETSEAKLKNKKFYIGIDVSYRIGKKLGIAVIEDNGKNYAPFYYKGLIPDPPVGRGNADIVNENNEMQVCINEVLDFLSKLKSFGSIECIALDTPCTFNNRDEEIRDCEMEMKEHGINCFKTFSTKEKIEIVNRAKIHLKQNKPVATIPNANRLWMIFGHQLFLELKKAGYNCIETYPNAIISQFTRLDGEVFLHKSTSQGLKRQKELIKDIFQTEIDYALIAFGSTHDKIDSLLCAWVAALSRNNGAFVYGKKNPLWVQSQSVCKTIKNVREMRSKK